MKTSTQRRRRIHGFVTAAITSLCVLATATAALAATEDQKLTASDRRAWAQFGVSVALSGDTLVVGAVFDNDGSQDFGAAYVFVRTGGTWTQQAKLTAADATAGDRFGHSVAVSGDTVIIGAMFDDDSGSDSGSAYIFTRTGTTWTQSQKLVGSDVTADANFGWSVAISGDTAFIGARWDSDAGLRAGSAYVFTRNGTTWTESQKLLAWDATTNTGFGASVAFSDDTALIGADGDSEAAVLAGAVYVFSRSGSTWSPQDKLIAAVPAFSAFGFSVALSGDTAVIGAPFDDDASAGIDSGSAYVFTRTGTTWTQQAKMAASDMAGDDRFGLSVALVGDTAIIGSVLDDDAGTDSGSAYVFTRSGTAWNEKEKLTASDAAALGQFGYWVAFSGGTAVIGANGGSNPEIFSGSAYVFGLDQDTDGDGIPDDVDCNPNSDVSPTVVIDGIDTGVQNTLFDDGCTIADDIAAIAAASKNHGQFVSTITNYLNDLKKNGVITAQQKSAIQKAAAKANIP